MDDSVQNPQTRSRLAGIGSRSSKPSFLGHGVTAGRILEPSLEQRPLRGVSSNPDLGVVGGGEYAALKSRPAPPVLPVPNADGTPRSIPLETFHWGARDDDFSTAPRPLLRGDHVLILVHSGCIRIEFPRRKVQIGGKALAFVPSGTAFSLQIEAAPTGQVLLLPPLLRSGLRVTVPDQMKAGGIPLDLQAPVRAAFEWIAAHPGQTSSEARKLLAQIDALVEMMDQLTDDPAPSGPIAPAPSAGRALVKEYLALADAQLTSGRTIPELAKMLGSSLADLDAACRDTLGRTPLNLLYEMRLKRAVMMLRTTALPISRIASDLGYGSTGHFIRAFSNATGRSPAAFRDEDQTPSKG